MTDQWEELERLAKAATALLASGAFGDHAKAEWWAFRRAANPETVLSLIAAARANPTPAENGR